MPVQRDAGGYAELHADIAERGKSEHGGDFGYRGVCELYADAGAAGARARDTEDRERERDVYEDWVRALPYGVDDDGCEDCERVGDFAQRGALESDGEPLFGPAGAPHGQGTGGRNHPGRRGAG